MVRSNKSIDTGVKLPPFPAYSPPVISDARPQIP
jgi:hypothetical protein